MTAERFPKSLIKRGGGGGVSFNSHNLSTVDPMSKIFGFSESLEKFVSNDVFQSKISSRPNLSFSGLGPWAIIHGTA